MPKYVFKLRILREESYPGFSRWTLKNSKCSYKSEAEGDLTNRVKEII